MQIYLLASNFNTDAWKNQFLWYRTHNLLRIITNSKREENPHTFSPVWVFPIVLLFFFFFLISFPFFSSIHYCLWPPRFTFQENSSWQHPSQVCGCWRQEQADWAPSSHCPPPPPANFTCKGAAALILVPKSSSSRLAQTFSSSGLVSKRLPAQALTSCLCYGWAVPEGAALTHWEMLWQSLKTKKKKKTSKHFHLSSPRALSRHSWRGTLKMCIFL